VLLVPIHQNKPSQITCLGCANCALFSECGGIDELMLWGCVQKCADCGVGQCDWTCPKNCNQFWSRFREVGGWPPKPPGTIRTSANLNLPIYLPQIYNGNDRQEVLTEPIVAVPTFCVVKGRKNGGYGPVADDPASFRQKLKLARNAKVVLISVAQDKYLERFWKYAESCDVGHALRELDIEAITTPNFSYFSDIPRPHFLWNLARMSRMSEYLSSCGINVVPHIHAATKRDWSNWEQTLIDQRQITHVAREFQTGGSVREVAMKSIHELADLRDKLGRELHLLAIGGSQYGTELGKFFPKLTLVDSTPFMKTHKRRKFVQRPRLLPHWVKNRTAKGESLGRLLQANIASYRIWLESRIFQQELFKDPCAGRNGRNPALQSLPDGHPELSMDCAK
jgi:hypothetical protein